MSIADDIRAAALGDRPRTVVGLCNAIVECFLTDWEWLESSWYSTEWRVFMLLVACALED
jgi:hypothetical protein